MTKELVDIIPYPDILVWVMTLILQSKGVWTKISHNFPCSVEKMLFQLLRKYSVS